MPATTGKALVACGERRCLSRRDQARIANPAAHQQSGAIKARGSVDQSGFASGNSMSMTSASETTATSTAPINTCHQRRTNQPITKLGTKIAGLAKPLISCEKPEDRHGAPVARQDAERSLLLFFTAQSTKRSPARSPRNGDKSRLHVSGRRRCRLLRAVVLRRSPGLV